MRTLKRPWLLLSLTALLAIAPRNARAADWGINTKINLVEGTYVPDGIYVWVSTLPPSSAGCNSNPGLGTVLAYPASGVTTSDQKENVKAVYASLVNAVAEDMTVRIGGLNRTQANGQCSIQEIYFAPYSTPTGPQ